MSQDGAGRLRRCLDRFQEHKNVGRFLGEISAISDLADVIPDELATAYRNGDFLSVELLVLAGKRHPSRALVPIACRILRNRNESLNYEDVVDLLDVLRSADAVECLAETLAWEPDWDEYRNLGVKCIWALQAIGTDEALQLIRAHLGSESPEIREAAARVLENTAASVGSDTTSKVIR